MCTLRHEERMGEFALQYERCEGAEVVVQTTADGPAGRCVQTTIDGYPVYKQVKGDNWLYYYEPSRMWVIDTEFTCAIKCTPLFSMKGGERKSRISGNTEQELQRMRTRFADQERWTACAACWLDLRSSGLGVRG